MPKFDDKVKVKMHHFVLNILQSKVKGAMTKTKAGIYRINDEDNFVYECGKCRSAFETNQQYAGTKNLVELNKEITLRFPCI